MIIDDQIGRQWFRNVVLGWGQQIMESSEIFWSRGCSAKKITSYSPMVTAHGRCEVTAHLASMVVALTAVGVCLWRVGEVNTSICTVCTVGTAFLTLVPIKNTPLSFFLYCRPINLCCRERFADEGNWC